MDIKVLCLPIKSGRAGVIPHHCYCRHNILPNFHDIVTVNCCNHVVFGITIYIVSFLILPQLINDICEELPDPTADTVISDSNQDNNRGQRRDVIDRGHRCEWGGEGFRKTAEGICPLLGMI